MNATIETLVEKGYAATTIKEVCARAGMTRGAPQHHFQTKEQLVIAAVEHLFRARLTDFAAAFGRLPKSGRTDRALIDLIWPGFGEPFFIAWLEVLMASRTDRALQNAVREADRRFDEAILDLSKQFSETPGPQVVLFLSFIFSFMSGAIIESRFAGSSRAIRVPTTKLIGLLKECIGFLEANPKLLRKYAV